MPVLYTNNALSNLSASITNSATSLSVTAGTGVRFPNPGGSDYFYATITDASGEIEIVRVTSRMTDSLTVVRGQDGTTARAWGANANFELRVNRAMLDDFKTDTRDGNAATATALQTARTIGGVSFNGTANINLPGVNTAGDQNTTGSAASLTTARAINGTSFNGSANITTANWGTARTLTIGATGKSVNGSANVAWTLAEIGAAAVNANTTGSAGSLVSGARTVTADTSQNYHSWQFRSNQTTDSAIRILGSDGSFRGSYYGDGVSQGFLNSANGWVVRFNNGELQSGTVPVGRITGTLPVANGGTGNTTGNAATATTLQTARTINGVSFNGSANITVADGTKLPLAGGTMTGTITNSAASLVIGNSGGVIRGYLYNDSSGFGLLTSGGGWAARVNFGTANVNFFGSVLLTSNSTSIRQTTTANWSGDAGASEGKLEYHSNRWYVNAGSSSTEVVRFRRGATDVGHITNAGALVMSSTITANSDERLKKDWSDLPADFVERLAQVKHGTYTRVDSGERQIGVSAQSLQPLAPEGVLGSDILSVAYGNVALVSSIELAKRVVALEEELRSLKESRSD